MKEAYYMDASKSYHSIVDFHYTKPHQYKPLIDILKHVVEDNTWNITHTLQHRQVAAKPCYR